VKWIAAAMISVASAIVVYELNSQRSRRRDAQKAIITAKSAKAAHSTMPMRAYKTNINFEQTFRSLLEKWIIIYYDGNACFQLPEYPNLIQIDLNGVVKIYEGTRELDQRILAIITPYVKTLESQAFKWEALELTLGEEQLSKSADGALLLNATISYLTEVYSEMVSRGVIPPESLRGLRDNIQTALQSKDTIRDLAEGRKVESEIRALLGMEGKYATISSVWPAGNPYSGLRGFAIVNSVPVAALLTGSTDDLIFKVNTSGTIFSPASSRIDTLNDSSQRSARPYETWDTIAIYIPPGFVIPSADQIVSIISNKRASIQVRRTSLHDPFGPRWTVVYVSANTATHDSTGLGQTSQNNPFTRFESDKECCYVRIKGVTASPIAGKYAFKIAFLKRKASEQTLCNDPIDSTKYDENSQFLPLENWPVILVKGEISPALVSGTLRGGDRNQPIQKPGRVEAVMTTRLDPYTGQARPDLPLVNAVGYFNATAQGHYEVEGLAPGVYDLYASAAGYPKTLVQSGFTVLKGQSLHFDGYLQPGPVIHGNVFTKHKFGDEPWPETMPIRIELYDAPTLNHIPDRSANLVSWSGGFEANISTERPHDVGPPQDWLVEGGTKLPFHFEFGMKGEYGAPRDIDGMVPQLYATWVNGLTPGRYYARAWVDGYGQSAVDGSTFQEYFFDVIPNEFAGEVRLSLDLRLKTRVRTPNTSC
jgi:hypothetical protein